MDEQLEIFFARLNYLVSNVVNRRTGKLFSQADLESRTAELGHRVSAAHINRMLNGKSANPNLKTILVLAEALDVSAEYFFKPNNEITFRKSQVATNANEISEFVSSLKEAIAEVEREYGIDS